MKWKFYISVHPAKLRGAYNDSEICRQNGTNIFPFSGPNHLVIAGLLVW